jgi:predicted chitinase
VKETETKQVEMDSDLEVEEFFKTSNAYYLKLSRDTRIDFIGNPDLITVEANAVIAALEYWKNNNLNKYADLDDLDAISDIINRGHRTEKSMQTVMSIENHL